MIRQAEELATIAQQLRTVVARFEVGADEPLEAVKPRQHEGERPGCRPVGAVPAARRAV